MTKNEEIIFSFYTYFKEKNIQGMQNLYADQTVFNDAVFKNLNATEVRGMWEMLIKRGKDLSLNFSDIKEIEENIVTAKWVATYTFSGTGNLVQNIISAKFKLEKGKIIEHTDHFDFYTWASQALGLKGKLLGWTGFLQKKVQETAAKNLANFLTK